MSQRKGRHLVLPESPGQVRQKRGLGMACWWDLRRGLPVRAVVRLNTSRTKIVAF